MFCNKCGKEIPDGSVCSCSAQAQGNSVAITIPPVKSLIVMGVALLTFIFTFVDWYKATISAYGYSQSTSVGAMEDGIGDVNFLFGLAKFLVIVNIFVFVLYLVAKFVDLGKFVPGLAKVDLGKLLQLAYFGISALALVCGLIACFVGDEYDLLKYGPAIGWIFSLIFTAAGLVFTVKSDILDKIVPAK